MRRIAIFDLPFRGRCEFTRLLGNPGLRAVRVNPYDYHREFRQGADLIIIPGSARTTCDLEYLRATGGESIICRHLSLGGSVLGICGGYQMIGGMLYDPYQTQGPSKTVAGIGLLPTVTVFGRTMMSCETDASLVANGAVVSGLEYRSGASFLQPEHVQRPLLKVVKRRFLRPQPDQQVVSIGEPTLTEYQWHPGCEEMDGYVSGNGKVWGTYLHLICDNFDFNRLLLSRVAERGYS